MFTELSYRQIIYNDEIIILTLGVEVNKKLLAKNKDSLSAAKLYQSMLFTPLRSEETITLQHHKSNDHKIKWQHLNKAGLTSYWIFSFSFGYETSRNTFIKNSSLMENYMPASISQ